MIWLPDNPLMRSAGPRTLREEGIGSLRRRGRRARRAGSSPARREMFLAAGSEMITFPQRMGVRLGALPGMGPTTTRNHPGGNVAGRAVEGVPFDAAALGVWSDKLQPAMARTTWFVLAANELRSVQYFNRSARAFAVATWCSPHAPGGPRREVLPTARRTDPDPETPPAGLSQMIPRA